MKRSIVVCLSLSLLLLAPQTFSQQRASTPKDRASEAAAAPAAVFVGGVSSSEGPIVDARGGAEIFPARGGDVDWGLALSGGGIRSAAFSIGVMKALYDSGRMKNIDVISSVSGGGYASYWLFTRHRPSDAHFGDSIFRDEAFIRNVCDLQNKGKSEFFPLGRALKVFYKGTFGTYRESIFKSFGGRPNDTKVDFLNEEIERGDAPYFIINATVSLRRRDEKKEELKKPSSTVFEITPEFRGNPGLGFRGWTSTGEGAAPTSGARRAEDKDAPLTLSESIAASGIPWWATRYWVNNYEGSGIKGKRLYLSDGGHSENLAALALIRRGVKNIIIADSEQDAAYKFDAYLTLQKMLKKENIALCVPDIERFLKKPDERCAVAGIAAQESKDKNVFAVSAVSVGEAAQVAGTGGAEAARSRIYYIKMTKPEPVLAERFADEAAAGKGYEIAKERKEDYANGGCGKIEINFRNEKDPYANLYTYVVKNYSASINDPKFSKGRILWAKLRLFNAVGKVSPFFSYKFPHTTTVDQSYFSDQLEAFVGLGYLQAVGLEKIIEVQEKRQLHSRY